MRRSEVTAAAVSTVLFFFAEMILPTVLWSLPSPLRSLLGLPELTKEGAAVLKAFLFQLIAYQVTYVVLGCFLTYAFRTVGLSVLVGLVLMKSLVVPLLLGGIHSGDLGARLSSVLFWSRVVSYLTAALAGGFGGRYLLTHRKRTTAAAREP